jgi:hypothetical protein
MARIQHMVLLKVDPGIARELTPRLFRALGDLQKVIPGMLYYSGGAYSSPEGFNQGYTHGFLMTFQDAAARDLYLTHPEHEKVKAEFLPRVEAAVAFDFEEALPAGQAQASRSSSS